MRTLCAIVVSSFIVLAAAVTPAAGADYYFVADGYWDDATKWKDDCNNGNEGQVPSASDNAVICSSVTCTIRNDDAVCLGLTVDGTLILGNSDTLEIHANSSIPGTMTVENYGTLNIDASLTLSGGEVSFGILHRVSG
ncbi:MAG: hypothetical protein ABIG44_16855 [Planctomycetota bacterium]